MRGTDGAAMSALTDRIIKVLEAELDEHGCEDDDEKRWQLARHWAERVAEALQLTEDLRRINPKTKAKPCDNCGHLKGVHASPCVILNRDYRECGCPEHSYSPPNTSWERRWVSGWTAVEEGK